jgi:hypothetical protein
MAMNRRNVLIGLGAVAAGGGALLGTGAFSQVEATRSVSISTAGDSGALLSLTLETASYNGLSDTSGSDSGTNDADTIQIDLEEINDDAVTTFDDALTIENNGNNPVDLSIDESSLDGVTFTLADGSVGADANDDTDQTTADIEVDTTGSVSGGDITITAADNS